MSVVVFDNYLEYFISKLKNYKTTTTSKNGPIQI